MSTIIQNDTFIEPLLREDPNGYTIYPIKHWDTWELYKKQIASFWTAEEIVLIDDLKDWENKLSDNDRYFISHILAFFAGSDGIVLENLAGRFMTEIGRNEAKFFYCFQATMETIHSETYSLLIETLIKDQKQKDKLFKAIDTIPCIQQKASWAVKWIGKNDKLTKFDDNELNKLNDILSWSKSNLDGSACSMEGKTPLDSKKQSLITMIDSLKDEINCARPTFAERLIGFACVEGIFFSGSFCAIFWLKKRGVMPGLCFSNELISRDEGLHCRFAVHLYSQLENKLSTERIHEIVSEAVSIEKEFILEALPCKLIGMNAGMMSQYIEYVADRLCNQLGYPSIYNSENPFDWMEMISLQGKTNFFERKVSEYKKANVLSTNKEDDEIRFDAWC